MIYGLSNSGNSDNLERPLKSFTYWNEIFRTAVQKLTRFQLTMRVARSLCDSCASFPNDIEAHSDIIGQCCAVKINTMLSIFFWDRRRPTCIGPAMHFKSQKNTQWKWKTGNHSCTLRSMSLKAVPKLWNGCSGLETLSKRYWLQTQRSRQDHWIVNAFRINVFNPL